MADGDTNMADANQPNGSNGNSTTDDVIPEVLDDGYKHFQRIHLVSHDSEASGDECESSLTSVSSYSFRAAQIQQHRFNSRMKIIRLAMRYGISS